MTGSQHSNPDLSRVFLLGRTYEASQQVLDVAKQTLELTRQIHAHQIENTSPPPAGLFSTETLIRYAKLLFKALRVFGPLLQPHIMPWLAWIPAGVVAFWKLFLRDFLGW